MRTAILLAAVVFASGTSAAEITRQSGSNGVDLISVSGPLNAGDEDNFRKIAAESGKAIVVLNSEGGIVTTGLEIGKAIKLRGFATAVAPNTLCASACSLAWLAGEPRFLDATSKLGFHAAYRVVDGKATESGVGNALVGAYLNQIGLPDSAIVYVTSAPPEGIEWLTPQAAAQVGIEFAALNETAAPSKMLRTVSALRCRRFLREWS